MDDELTTRLVSEADADGDLRLTDGERRAMLEEIARIGLAWGRDSGSPFGAHPAPAETTSSVAVQERIALLLRCWPEIMAGLNSLARQPDTQLIRQSVSLPMTRTQGGPESAARIARSPGALRAWLRSHAPSEVQSHSAPPMLEERRPAASFDTPANRFVVTLLQTFASEAEALACLAAFCGENDDAARLADAARQARQRQRTPPLDGLPSLRDADCAKLGDGNATLRHNPIYAALVHSWQTLHAHLYFDWTALPWLRLPSVEAWRLYEIWCFLKTAETLINLGWQQRDSPAIRVRNRALRLELATARDSRLRFRRATDVLDLFYQPLFSSANQRRQAALSLPDNDTPEFEQSTSAAPEPAHFVSTSHAMQPDIALIWRGASGTRLFLLDAKFRRYAEPGDEQNDVNKMHTYRDAIVAANPAPRPKRNLMSPRPAVSAAWCVFAGGPQHRSASSPPPSLALEVALRTYPRPTPSLPFGSAPVGAVRMRPGEPDNTVFLHRLLAHWLNE